ncbi:MAG: hypothetical protein ACPG6T_03900 [Paracoccaceae bacterium]
MDILKQFFASYGSVVFGLIIGALAHIGRLMSEHKIPTFIQITGYTLQLGLIGLIAVNATKFLGISEDDTRALATALLAISTQEVVQAVKRLGWRGLLTSVLKGMGLKIQEDEKKT